MANGENVYPEAIEHKINTHHWVMESLVVEDQDQLVAWVYPDYEYIDTETDGKTAALRQEFIDTLLDSMREELNAELPRAARLTKIVERPEPFIKTATHKIKRYLYSDKGGSDD
jgi:long-chain acyl-CoA synthetase